jgi:2'-hydroxyisoflavone reductase
VTTRRTFLTTTAGAGAALLLGKRSLALPADIVARTEASLNILILGGTGYIGPYQVREAIARGHRVTVFNRGITQAELPASVTQLRGDRSIEKLDLESLKGKSWDAAIDNWQADPACVTKTAELLKNSVKYYLYVSSTGVFLPYLTPDIKEDVKPVLVDPGATTTTSYGVMKALSEIENTKAFGNRAINVRPNFIVGPEDPKPRFPYWPLRYARGGEILVPGNPTDKVQCADVRDLTAFMIHLIETGTTGTFNAGGDPTMTMQKFQDEIARGVPSRYTRTWIADIEFLRTYRFATAIPWLPSHRNAKGEVYGQTNINSDKAIAAGLTFRPMADTARDTLRWFQSLSPERQRSYDFPTTPEHEAEALKAWKARHG